METKVQIIEGAERGEELELELQEDFTLCVASRFLMKAWWNRRPRERTERDKREKQATGDIHDAEMGKGIFLTRGGTVKFWGTGPERWTMLGAWRVQQLFRMQSRATMSFMMRGKKNRATTSLDQFFKRVDRTESSKEAMPSYLEWVRSQLALHLSYLWDPSALLLPAPSPPSCQWLFLPVHAMPAPACQLLYRTPVHAGTAL